MAYLGAQPNKTLTKTTSQSFNGTGSATTFTLNRAVNTEEELEVFVENVQQEPGSGKSYTAAGTTLTFDEAPPSGTGNIYVIYRGLAEVTTRLEHDANQALSATTGTFSDAVTVANGLTVDDDGATVLTVDRATSDGTIVDFQKDGTSVGSIASQSGTRMVVSGVRVLDGDTGDTGLQFAGSAIYPRDGQALADNATTLGHSSYRFADLYLGGNLYIGGTGSANALDDYEEGTWTPTVQVGTCSVGNTRYVKIGQMVTLMGRISNLSDRTSGNHLQIGGIPFDIHQYATGSTSVMGRYVNNGGDAIHLYAGANGSLFSMYTLARGADYTGIGHNDINSASFYLYFTITYITDA